MKQTSLIFYVIIFAVLFAISFYILRNHPTNTNNQDQIESYGTNITFKEYDATGHLQYLVTMRSATQYRKTGDTKMVQPRLETFATASKPAWHVRADHGVANKAGDQVLLTGHVVMHQLPMPHHPETTITTTSMLIFTKTSQAKTTAPVKIVRPGTVIHGIGMTANLKTGEYQILSQPHAVIDLEKQPKN